MNAKLNKTNVNYWLYLYFLKLSKLLIFKLKTFVNYARLNRIYSKLTVAIIP